MKFLGIAGWIWWLIVLALTFAGAYFIGCGPFGR